MSPSCKIIKFMKNVKPTRIWIDGKSFSISKYEEKDSSTNSKYEEKDSSTNSKYEEKDSSTNSKYEEKDTSTNVVDSSLEEWKANYNISYTNNLYCTAFRLPSIYYEKLQNLPHFTIKELEVNTSATINIPDHESNDCIVVRSKDIESVIDARNKLHTIFSVIRESQNVLQFISIPVINDDIKRNFEHFKNEILQNEVDGLHESIFQKPERLHLTIGVFSLLDDTERSEAITALNECKDKIIDPITSKLGQLKIKLCGLDCMNTDYKKVNILYANALVHGENEDDILQPMVNSISKHFYSKGLIRQYQENVKVHVTLINTKYRKSEGKKRKWKDRKKTFNATTIMEKYKDFHFGECDLKEIHLSWISKIDNNGYYKPLSVVTV